MTFQSYWRLFAVIVLVLMPAAGHAADVARFGVFEQSFTTTGSYANPYSTVTATATFTPPGGGAKTIPLFWDGGATWKVRFAPDTIGTWNWSVASSDAGLTGQSGSFVCVTSTNQGGIRARPAFPYHFEHQDGSPFWLSGDTQWRIFGKDTGESLSHATVLHYIDVRAAQGINFIHSNLLSPGVNEGGAAFSNYITQVLTPAYWQEVDSRVAYLNQKGITSMIFLAWANTAPSWASFPNDAARLRYARYVVARYAAYNTAFSVSGEWNETSTKAMYLSIGNEIQNSDPHGRMITIHSTGSVEEFASESWMGFGDYQQIYDTLHARILGARVHNKPVVNAEYGYYLRDNDGNGAVDKPNSATLQDIRDATWDIAMAGGYLLTGWGTTYLGGQADPGPFNVDDPKNDDWEDDIQHVKALFTGLTWWTLQPSDALIVSAPGPRTADTTTGGVRRPPLMTYWALAKTGQQYVMYCRGYTGNYSLSLGGAAAASYSVTRFDPRTGTSTALSDYTGTGPVTITPSNAQDWVYVLKNTAGSGNQPPSASISAAQTTVLPNQTVAFTVIASDTDGAITNHVWHWGNADEAITGTPATNMTHSWSSPGQYNVSLTVTDNGSPPLNAESNVITINVTTNLPPVITRASATPNSGYAPLFAAFTGSATDPENDTLTYEWDFDADGIYDATGATAQFTYTSPGHFDPVLRVSDGINQVTQQLTVDVAAVPNSGAPVTVDFGSEADTYIYQTNPTTNYGTTTEMTVGGGTARRDVFIRFNPSSLPAGVTVTSAKIILVCSNASVDVGGGGTIRKFSPSVEQWLETQPTWNSPLAGSDAGGDLSTLGPVSIGSTYEFTNLKSAVTGNGRVTFVIRSAGQDGAGYRTKEYGTSSQRPILRVTYVTSPFQNWRESHFNVSQLADLAISGPNADPEKDGISNLLEYALALNPWASDTAGLPVVGNVGDHLTLTYLKDKTATDILYSVEASDDPGTGWNAAGITDQTLSDDGTYQQIEATDAFTISGNPKRFMRLKITSTP